MKRLIAALVVSAAALSAAAPSRDGLGRTFTKLNRTGQLTIGYLGGSITAGSGASKPEEFSYRALVTKWFRDQYPKAEIKAINAAIGGTGSDLGVFRCGRDLLAGKPDLVFVEFAVNDGGGNEKRVLRSMEGIVRQVWRANPMADIVFLYTINKNSMAETYDKGELPKTVIWHERIAAAYRIPSLNVGQTIYKTVKEGKNTWEKLLPDNVHPSDAGYAIYTAQIAAFLDAHRKDKKAKARTRMPKPLSEGPFENARLEDPTPIQAEGWKHDDPSLAKRFAHSISSDTAGATFDHKFKGTAIGVMWMIAPDSGDIEWSIDGGAPQRSSSWDSYALKFSRVNYRIFSDSLAPGEHTLRVKVLAEKNAQSKGTWIRIGPLMVN